MDIQIITAPLIGGLIGLLTNGIAIKMMFRPLKPVYIGKFRVPLTPGIIPKEKERIARAVGRVVGSDILDDDTIKKALLSDNVHDKINSKMDEILKEYKEMDISVGEYLENKNHLEMVDRMESKASENISEYIRKKMIDADVGMLIVETAFTEISAKLNPMILAIAGNAINSAKAPIALKINNMVDEKAGVMVKEYIDDEYKKITEYPVGKAVSELDSKYPELKEKIWNAYTSLIEKKLKNMLETFDVASVVEKKIIELDIEEMEKLILAIINKELNAIIYLGGVLGIIMGFINLLF
ncbi:MAG TPA: hypothetical protein DCS38_03060 [Ruminococcus sp.]|nr:hypothetical protein [Ruminococcus sp.]HBN11241.1 hypothetical protein [Ruminococcus sp.]HCR74559.1 hypothetical protein [Ruminococcus sp.]